MNRLMQICIYQRICDVGSRLACIVIVGSYRS
jgi:hypothetical protein